MSALRDDGFQSTHWDPERIAYGIAHLYEGGDVLSGTPALAASQPSPSAVPEPPKVGGPTMMPHDDPRRAALPPSAPEDIEGLRAALLEWLLKAAVEALDFGWFAPSERSHFVEPAIRAVLAILEPNDRRHPNRPG